jgi:hypothetical protein
MVYPPCHTNTPLSEGTLTCSPLLRRHTSVFVWYGLSLRAAPVFLHVCVFAAHKRARRRKVFGPLPAEGEGREGFSVGGSLSLSRHIPIIHPQSTHTHTPHHTRTCVCVCVCVLLFSRVVLPHHTHTHTSTGWGVVCSWVTRGILLFCVPCPLSPEGYQGPGNSLIRSGIYTREEGCSSCNVYNARSVRGRL